MAGGHVIMFSCIKSDGQRRLVKINGNAKKQNISLLQSNLLPDYKDVNFQHGNVTHTPKFLAENVQLL